MTDKNRELTEQELEQAVGGKNVKPDGQGTIGIGGGTEKTRPGEEGDERRVDGSGSGQVDPL